jgi:flavodoxin
MKIGIILHSQSGHTATFAKAIAAKFTELGHETDTILLMTSGLSRPTSRRFTISNAPMDSEIARFDAVLFGGPVWAFKASPVIMKYLASIGTGTLKGRKALAFVTMGFPWKALGASRALYSMTRKLESFDADVLQGEMLRYLFGFNKKRLAQAVEKITSRVTGSQS